MIWSVKQLFFSLGGFAKVFTANLHKHGIAFAEVESVFYDEFALTREDGDAVGEARFITVGVDALGRVVTVCWTQRGESIRLISARLASPQERKSYEN